MSVRVWGILATALLATACGTAEAVQYPPGQRPCKEALAALDLVGFAQGYAGRYSYDPNDRDGLIRQTLRDAKVALSYRAGPSEHYTAALYDLDSDAVLATIDPLIDAYDREDPDTPYQDATDWWDRYKEFQESQRTLEHRCSY